VSDGESIGHGQLSSRPASTRSAISHLFVYGTLRPGDVRWHLLEPFVNGEGAPDTVAGELFDTGHNYPAAIFGPGGIIQGRTYELHLPPSAVSTDASK